MSALVFKINYFKYIGGMVLKGLQVAKTWGLLPIKPRGDFMEKEQLNFNLDLDCALFLVNGVLHFLTMLEKRYSKMTDGTYIVIQKGISYKVQCKGRFIGSFTIPTIQRVLEIEKAKKTITLQLFNPRPLETVANMIGAHDSTLTIMNELMECMGKHSDSTDKVICHTIFGEVLSTITSRNSRKRVRIHSSNVSKGLQVNVLA